MIKELVEYVVKQLVSDPDAVSISVVQDGNRYIIEITVEDRDRGRVIGKNGKTIKSLRTLVDVIAADKKIQINIAQ